MSITIEQVVEQVVDWAGKDVQVKPFSGGLTNANFQVLVDGTPYFVRIPGESTELLAIDRKNEYYNTNAAHQAGVGPKVVHYLPEADVMVLEYIQGQTMSNARFQEPGLPTRIAHSLKCLHSGPRFLNDFNMFRLVEFYMSVVDQYQVPIPAGYREKLPVVARIEKALLVNPVETVPCNNDLLAENYIDDGQILRLIDFEYSGNNDPCFELGNTCQELGYDESRIIEMCGAYFGRPSPARIARMKLQMIMSDVGWGLWAAIQAKISKIEFDFWGWAVERWSRAEEKMNSLELALWLKDVQIKEDG